MPLESTLSICLGLGLAAACGFRVFVPLLVMSVAAYTGFLDLSPSFAWIGGMPAMITLAVATLMEIGAYYIPWLDHFLDTIASPTAVVAGVIVTASVVTGLDPYLKWTLAVIAGGGIAGAVQAVTVGTRGLSALSTAGIANPLVSTVEVGGSLLLSLLAIFLPIVALFLLLVVAVFGWRRMRRPRVPQIS